MEICDIVTRGWKFAYSTSVPGGYLKNENTIRDALEKLELHLFKKSFQRNNNCYERAKRLERKFDGKLNPLAAAPAAAKTVSTATQEHFMDISDILK
jgi:hypothetical protein